MTSDSVPTGWRRPALSIIISLSATIILFLVAIFAVILPEWRSQIRKERLSLIEERAWTAVQTVEQYDRLYRSGRLSLATAQTEAAKHIRRWQSQATDDHCIWLCDTLGNLVLLPALALDSEQDDDLGRPVSNAAAFKDSLTLAIRNGGGHFKYRYRLNDDTSESFARMGYVATYEPWGWAIGTSLSMHDIARLNRASIYYVILASTAVLIAVSLLLLWVVRHGYIADHERGVYLATLRDREARLRTVLETIQAGVILSRQWNETIVDINPVGAQLLGYPREFIVGQKRRRFRFRPECSRDEKKHSDSSEATWLVRHADGRDIPVTRTVACMQLGSESYTLECLVDITGLKKAQEQLRQRTDSLRDANEALETSRRRLEEFVYSVSHNLKAPLVSIRGFGQMLSREMAEYTTDRSRHYLDRIVANGEQMQSQINDLLRLNREGSLDETCGPVDLNRVVGDLVTDFSKGHSPDRHIEFLMQYLPPVLGRRSRLRDVFLNLLDNAVKYMPDNAGARIEVGYDPDVRTSDGRQVGAFFVRDNGRGIPFEEHDLVFQQFRRGRTEAGSEGGSGIGLAHVRSIVELHGGEIWIDSKPGDGATFYFSLPLIEPHRSSRCRECASDICSHAGKSRRLQKAKPPAEEQGASHTSVTV